MLRSGWMVWVAGVLSLAVAPAVLLAQDGLSGIVLTGSPGVPGGEPRQPGDTLAGGLELQAGGRPGSLYLWSGSEEAPATESLVQYSASARIHLVGESGAVELIELVSGSLVATHRTSENRPLLIRVVPGGVPWVRLTQGTLWISAEAGNVRMALTQRGGRATRFDAPMPDDPAAAGDGRAVEFDAAAQREAEALAASVHSQAISVSADDYLTRAERGDLLPNDPNVAQAQATVAQTPQVAIARADGQAVTQSTTAAVTQTLVTGTGAAGVQSTFSGVSALLASGNPASVIVATRFERARLVGVSPTTSGAFFGTQAGFLGFNTQVRRPFTISR